MKIINNHIFTNFGILPFSVSVKGLLDSMCCIIGFDGVFGSVTGVVYSVGFGVLSSVVIFT